MKKNEVLGTFSVEDQAVIHSFFTKVRACGKNKSNLTKKQRSDHARKMALARWKKEPSALLTSNEKDDIV